MEKSLRVGAMEDDRGEWVHDSSVDHRGRPPSRDATGSWKAAMFIISECPSIMHRSTDRPAVSSSSGPSIRFPVPK
jgi:hypothetical protein